MKKGNQPMDMVPCRKPKGELTFNGRTRASDGVMYDQYFGEGIKVYNTDGKKWYRLELNMGRVREYMASIGAKGGAKSKRTISPEQQMKMQAGRRKCVLTWSSAKTTKG